MWQNILQDFINVVKNSSWNGIAIIIQILFHEYFGPIVLHFGTDALSKLTKSTKTSGSWQLLGHPRKPKIILGWKFLWKFFWTNIFIIWLNSAFYIKLTFQIMISKKKKFLVKIHKNRHSSSEIICSHFLQHQSILVDREKTLNLELGLIMGWTTVVSNQLISEVNT